MAGKTALLRETDLFQVLPSGDVWNYSSYDQHTWKKTGTATFERWYTQAVNAAGLSTTSGNGQNVIRYFPFFVTRTQTIDFMGVEVTAAGTAGCLITCALYDSSNMLPNNLITNFGTVVGDATGLQKIDLTGSPLTLTPGCYLFAVNHNGASAPTIRAIAAAGTPCVLGNQSSGGTAFATYYFVTNTYTTAWPSTAISPTGGVTNSAPWAFFHRLSA